MKKRYKPMQGWADPASLDRWQRDGCVHLAGMPHTLDNLLKRPEWKGAKVRYYCDATGDFIYITKDRAELRLLQSVFSS